MGPLPAIVAGGLLIVVAVGLQSGSRFQVGVRTGEPGWRQLDLVRFLHARRVTLRRGLDIDGSPERVALEGEAPTDEQVLAVSEAIMDEFSVYPPGFFESGIVLELVLVRGLGREGDPLAGTIHGGARTLYLDAENGAMHPKHLRRTIHHELYHLMDSRDARRMAADREWERLSAPIGYAPALRAFEVSQGASEPSEDPLGFVSLYARTCAAEDKAELYEFLIMNFDYVEARCGWDRMLATKVGLLKARLVAVCRGLDEDWIDGFRRWRRAPH